jgi:hypothetical protein
MGIFGKLFGSEKLKVNDSDFGELESFFMKGNRVGWSIKKRFLGKNIEISVFGDKNGISEAQRTIILNALNNEMQIKSESEKALKQEFENAERDFISIDEHFNFEGMSVYDNRFEISFQENSGRYYFFNVHFENNKQVGVSIDS